ncbi:unnamed protein product [Linum trigynum]|uniref:Replication protein A OB domain-containing protein n=1 Tax=Linum trigynum TaxID=586398 RepID=A0AAV2E7S7_9ROSI
MYNGCSGNWCVEFDRNTIFEEESDVAPTFCLEKFEFVDFEELRSRVSNNFVLADVSGRLESIGEIDHVSTKHGLTVKQNAVLENERGFSISVTIWGAFAGQLNATHLSQGGNATPVIVAFSGMTVSEYRAETYLSAPGTSSSNNEVAVAGHVNLTSSSSNLVAKGKEVDTVDVECVWKTGMSWVLVYLMFLLASLLLCLEMKIL